MSFDETDIEERRIEHLCQLFLQLTAPKKDWKLSLDCI
jgi:hypothetical protein